MAIAVASAQLLLMVAWDAPEDAVVLCFQKNLTAQSCWARGVKWRPLTGLSPLLPLTLTCPNILSSMGVGVKSICRASATTAAAAGDSNSGE